MLQGLKDKITMPEWKWKQNRMRNLRKLRGLPARFGLPGMTARGKACTLPFTYSKEHRAFTIPELWVKRQLEAEFRRRVMR